MAHQTWGPLEASGAVLFSTPGETEALVGELAQAERPWALGCQAS